MSGKTPSPWGSSRKGLASYARPAASESRSPTETRATYGAIFTSDSWSREVEIGDVQRFDVHERRDVHGPDAVVPAVGLEAARLITIEAGRVNGSAASAFLGCPAKKRMTVAYQM